MRYLIVIFLLFLYHNSISQNITEIEGIVIDSANNIPIEFANIYLLDNNRIGTISNQEGNFNLKIDNTDTIVFSHIGYNTVSVFPKELNSFMEIKLSEKPIKLSEVVIKPTDVISIMNKVNSNLKNNHYLKPVYYKSFVRVWETTDNNLDVIEEYILNLYQKLPFPKFKIIKGRSKPFSEKAIKNFKERQLYNVIDIYTDYHILFLSDFLKQNKFDEYNYQFLKLVEIDNYTCYHILCDNKKNDKLIHLFVEQNSYGLARIEITLNKGNYIEESQRIVDFMRYNGQWFLKSSRYLYIPKNSLNKEIERVCSYTVIDAEDKNEYVTLRKIAKTKLNRYKSNFDNEFWGNNNFVPIPKFIEKQMK